MQLIENNLVVVPDGLNVANGPAFHQINLGNSSHSPRWRNRSPSAPLSVHLPVASCLDQVFHQLRSPLAICEDEPLDTLKLDKEVPVPGMILISVDPPRGPERVDSEGAPALPLPNIVPAATDTGIRIRPRMANPRSRASMRQAMPSDSGAAVSIPHRFSETPLRDRLFEIEHHQESFS